MSMPAGSPARPDRDPSQTLMFREAAEAPAAVRAQLERNREAVDALAGELRRRRPRAVLTAARGSSDHAATYGRYLLETRLGVLAASAAPSVASVYGAAQDLSDCLFLAISQSGRSPDLLASARAAAHAGARVVALVNDESSPLAAAAHVRLALHAGTERGVAATKSWIASCAALLHLAARWSGEGALAAALEAAPETLERAASLDWSAALAPLARVEHLYVIARGPGLAIAQEAALKLKETCGLHAEAFSSAEVRHGPQALLGPAFPALLLAQDDESREDMAALAAELVARGVPVVAAGVEARGATHLPVATREAALAPLAHAMAFYRLANALALARGRDPDAPPHLAKVTETR